MKNIYLVLLVLFCFSLTVRAQDTLTFEDFGLELDTFIDPVNIDSGLLSKGFFLPTTTSVFGEFEFWGSGWTVSTMRDTVTPGFENQYSARPGSGADGSMTFGLVFSQGLIQGPTGSQFNPQSVRVATNTYGYLSMLEGDSFNPDGFGGASGDVPDFYRVIFRKYLDGVLTTDSVEFFLADYRFEDNSLDTILADWQSVDLSSLGAADSLLIELDSRDKGTTTPFYVCIDNFVFDGVVSGVRRVEGEELELFPNPAFDQIQVQVPSIGWLTLWDLNGKRLVEQRVNPGLNPLNVEDVQSGIYLLRWTNGERIQTAKVIIR